MSGKKMAAKAKKGKDVDQAAAPKAKMKSMKWSDELTRKLLYAFIKQKETKKEQATGNATGMSAPGWNAITAAMNAKAPQGTVYVKNKLQNRIPTLVKDYKSYEFVMSKTGLGINGSTGAFTGDAEVQAELAATDTNCAKFFKVPLANYDLLDRLLR